MPRDAGANIAWSAACGLTSLFLECCPYCHTYSSTLWNVFFLGCMLLLLCLLLHHTEGVQNERSKVYSGAVIKEWCGSSRVFLRSGLYSFSWDAVGAVGSSSFTGTGRRASDVYWLHYAFSVT